MGCHFFFQGISLTQESNWRFLHQQADSTTKPPGNPQRNTIHSNKDSMQPKILKNKRQFWTWIPASQLPVRGPFLAQRGLIAPGYYCGNVITNLNFIWLSGKESACNAAKAGSIPGSGGSPGGENGNPFQFHGQRRLAGYS